VHIQHASDDWLTLAVLAGLSVMAALAGAGAGYLAYRRPPERWRRFEDSFEPLWGTWEAAYGVDDLYGQVLVAPGRRLSEAAAFSFDAGVVDGAVNGVGRMVRGIGAWARPLQTGFVRNYGVLFLAGAVVVVAWLVAGGT
jgi:NADH-quinone oxidoreductase subunit L